MEADKILHRSSLRGLTKCKECNHFNGIRATACKNKSCPLSQGKTKRKSKPKIHTVQLITKDDSKLFSVQIRDRDADNRNFVSIVDRIISSDASGSIISRNAICYVDTCKYDSNDVNISCKHVKSSLESCTARATAQIIDLNILNAMKLTESVKQKFWNLYDESKLNIPLIQRINQTTFVVRCDVSHSFPAGLLHVMLAADVKQPSYLCACKKIKILMSSNQSIILEREACEHVLLVFVSIMSSNNQKEEFKHFMPIIRPFFRKNFESLLASIQVEESVESAMINYHDGESSAISATLIENLDNIELIPISSLLNNNQEIDGQNMISFDESLALNEENCDETHMQSIDMENIPIINQINANENENFDEIELINCNVELMDGFKFTDKVEFCDEEILPESNQTDYLGMEGINDMADINSWSNDSNEFLDLCQNDILIEDFNDNSSSALVHGSLNPPTKIIPNILPVNTTNETICDSVDDDDEPYQNCSAIEILMYTNLLNSIIERINVTMDFNDDGNPDPLVFSIANLHFDMLRTKFSAGSKKKRIPNQTLVISDGKYKGLTKFCWVFSNIKLIKHIFTTNNMSLELERSFVKTPIGNFKYVESSTFAGSDEDQTNIGNTQLRKIRPTIYKTFLKSKCLTNAKSKAIDRYGLFSIEWIPSVLPKTQYGEMKVKLQFGHMKNDAIVQVKCIKPRIPA